MTPNNYVWLIAALCVAVVALFIIALDRAFEVAVLSRELRLWRHLLRRIAEKQLRISLPTDEEAKAPVESKLYLPDDLLEELEREEEERREEEAAEEREREREG